LSKENKQLKTKVKGIVKNMKGTSNILVMFSIY